MSMHQMRPQSADADDDQVDADDHFQQAGRDKHKNTGDQGGKWLEERQIERHAGADLLFPTQTIPRAMGFGRRCGLPMGAANGGRHPAKRRRRYAPASPCAILSRHVRSLRFHPIRHGDCPDIRHDEPAAECRAVMECRSGGADARRPPSP